MDIPRKELSIEKKKQYKALYYTSELIFLPIYLYFFIAFTGEQYFGTRIVLLILCVYSAYRILPKTFHKRFFNMAEGLLGVGKSQKTADFSVYVMIAMNILAKAILLYIMYGM